jgi:hypothetical protein
MDRLKKLEFWIEKGALFEKIDGVWNAFLEDEFIRDLGTGNSFEEMVDNMESPILDNNVKCEFKDIQVNDRFIYLDEEWLKITKSKAIRSNDGFTFTFYDTTIVN